MNSLTLIFVDLMNFINMFSKADATWKCGLFYLYEQYGYVFTDINGEMICYLHAPNDIFNVCDLHEHYFVSSIYLHLKMI